MRHAGFPKVISLTGLFVDSVKIVALFRWVLDVGRGDHEVSTVDDLSLPSVRGPGQHQLGLLRVRVLILLPLLLHCQRRPTVFHPQEPLSSVHFGDSSDK